MLIQIFILYHSQKIKILTTSLDFTFNKEICNASMPESSDLNALRSFKIWLLRDLPNVHMKAGVTVNKNYELFSTTINCCIFERQSRGNIFLRKWSEDMMKNMKFKLKCPFKQGFYEVGEHAIADEGFGNLPAFVRLNDTIDYFFSLNIKMKGQMLEFFSCNGTWNIQNV